MNDFRDELIFAIPMPKPHVGVTLTVTSFSTATAKERTFIVELVSQMLEYLKQRGDEIPPQRCPKCGAVHDRRSAIGRPATPTPGDFQLCLNCGYVQVFTHHGTLRELRPSEVKELPDDVRWHLARCEKARAEVMAPK